MSVDEILNELNDRFNCEEYDKALELLISVYEQEEYSEWALQNIYDCYMNANDEEFRNQFEQNNQISEYKYEDCVLDFVPYRDGEYMIFDKEKKEFVDVVKLNDIENAVKMEIFDEMEFSNVVAYFEWNWKEVNGILKECKNRKLYVIVGDVKRALSYYKISEFSEYLENIILFENENEFQKYFHCNINEYLPKIIFTHNELKRESLKRIVEEEHKYRLTPEGRSTDNILLTIGIPTHNRGNLLLKRLNHLLPMLYDSEIEIVVAKNGCILYEEEYEEAEKMQEQDARYVYYGVKEELKAQINWYNVIKHAHGKYVLLVSDEDDVIIGSLEHYLKVLSSNETLSVVRAGTTKVYREMKKRYAKKGIDAFKNLFLGQNYLSGLIFKREEFIKADVLQYDKFWDSSEFYRNYPHEWWCAALTKDGDSLIDPYLLIEEKEAVLKQEIREYEKKGVMKAETVLDLETELPRYATYEARFEQFKAQIEFIKIYMKNNSLTEIQTVVDMIIEKLACLLNVARRYGYKKDEYKDIVEQFADVSVKAMNQFTFDTKQQVELLTNIKNYSEVLFRLESSIK